MTDTNQLPCEREAFEAFAQNCPMGKYSITRRGDGYDSSHTQLMWDAWQARAQVQGEPVNLQHMAVAENGALRWMTGRKVQNCELYAMPDFGRAPTLYTTPQPAQATQAEVTDADIEQVLALAHSYADAKLMRYGALGIKEPPDPSAAFIELRRAILSLRPEKVPMTNEELKAARLRVCDDPNELPEPWAFRMGVYAAEAHHGITAQAKKETT